MLVKLTFYSTDGCIGSFDFDSECSNIVKTVELDSVILTVHIQKTIPYIISFTSNKEISLNKVCVSVSMESLYEGQEAYYYDAGSCTNAFACIRKYVKNEKNYWARDIFMAKGSGKVINMAFTTFKRFFTLFRFIDDSITAEYAFEDKVIKANEEYVLEHLLIDNKLEASTFFEQYTDYLKETHNIPDFKYIPCGWSSWSCYYGSVDEQKTIHEAKLLKEKLSDKGAKLIQIDDGWQKEGSFGAYWTTDLTKFPSGMGKVKDTLKEMDLDFGIWMAPGFVKDKSTRFEELYKLLVKEKDGSILKCFGGGESLIADKDGSIYALDIGKDEVLDLVIEMFTRGVNEYGAIYFKIDFITNLLYRAGNSNIPVIYEDGYSVELYNRFIKLIRDTVGDNVFLLACGAPIGESIGIFDSIRISPDITWGGAGKNGMPKPFEIIRNDAMNVILRSPYHKKVFINDPDALILRDYLSDFADDGLAMTFDEARLWATVVAMSGGHILLNEQIDKLRPELLELVRQIMPPMGVAARPVDFFEFPYCTETYIPFINDVPCEDLFYNKDRLSDNGAVLCAVYNWDENESVKVIDTQTYFTKETTDSFSFIAINAWSKEHITLSNGKLTLNLRPHSCEVFLLRPLKEGILFNDSSFYLGLDGKKE